MRRWQFLWLPFLWIGMLLGVAIESIASDAQYRVSYVYDGDTVKLQSLQSGQEIKLRITDIDAPERNQAYGKQSRRALIKLCKGSNIEVHAELAGIDQYNRHLGKLYCNHTDVSQYLMERGLAWYNSKYSSDTKLQSSAATARVKKVGLWKNRKPMPPWIWRQKHLPRSFN